MKVITFRSYIASIFPFIRPYWGAILASIFCAILFAMSNVYVIPLIKDITTQVSNKNMAYFNNHIFNAFLLFSVRLSSKYFQIYIMEKTSYQILLNLRLEIYRIIHYLPTNDYNEKKHGDIVSRIMDDGNKIKEAIYLNFESLIPNTLTILGVTGYLFYLNTELAMLSFFGAPLFVFTLSYFSKRLRKVSAHLQQSIGDITQMIQESLTNMKIIFSEVEAFIFSIIK